MIAPKRPEPGVTEPWNLDAVVATEIIEIRKFKKTARSTSPIVQTKFWNDGDRRKRTLPVLE